VNALNIDNLETIKREREIKETVENGENPI
jgi:hypothetical protein